MRYNKSNVDTYICKFQDEYTPALAELSYTPVSCIDLVSLFPLSVNICIIDGILQTRLSTALPFNIPVVRAVIFRQDSSPNSSRVEA